MASFNILAFVNALYHREYILEHLQKIAIKAEDLSTDLSKGPFLCYSGRAYSNGMGQVEVNQMPLRSYNGRLSSYGNIIYHHFFAWAKQMINKLISDNQTYRDVLILCLFDLKSLRSVAKGIIYHLSDRNSKLTV